MENKSCAICFDELSSTPPSQSQSSYTLICGHTYHRSCIQQWFNTSLTCPLCRRRHLSISEAQIRTVLVDGILSIPQLMRSMGFQPNEQLQRVLSTTQEPFRRFCTDSSYSLKTLLTTIGFAIMLDLVKHRQPS